MRKSIPLTIDEYIAALPAEQRATLEKLRKQLHTALPFASECISYRLPCLRHEGKAVVCFGAAANHCALYPMSDSIVKKFKAELKDYETSKGTIRFQPKNPLPASLLKKIVRERLGEIENRK